MRVSRCVWCGGRPGSAALRVGLLTLPALLWAGVFASLAGGSALERLSLIVEWGLCIAESW